MSMKINTMTYSFSYSEKKKCQQWNIQYYSVSASLFNLTQANIQLIEMFIRCRHSISWFIVHSSIIPYSFPSFPFIALQSIFREIWLLIQCSDYSFYSINILFNEIFYSIHQPIHKWNDFWLTESVFYWPFDEISWLTSILNVSYSILCQSWKAIDCQCPIPSEISEKYSMSVFSRAIHYSENDVPEAIQLSTIQCPLSQW